MLHPVRCITRLLRYHAITRRRRKISLRFGCGNSNSMRLQHRYSVLSMGVAGFIVPRRHTHPSFLGTLLASSRGKRVNSGAGRSDIG